MDTFAELFRDYGYPALVALGVVEFLGAPVAAAPVLMMVGAASATGGVDPFVAIAAVVFGALLGESAWFGVARWRGRRLLDMACGLASNPSLCVFSFAERMKRSGAGLLVAAKFIPGSGSVPAFAAGLSEFRYSRFLLADVAALLLWSGAYVAVGSVFHAEIDTVVEGAARHLAWVGVAGLGVLVVAMGWRIKKARAHRRLHAAHVPASRRDAGTGRDGIEPCQASRASQ